MSDAIPIPRDRLKRIVDRYGGIVKVLYLLKNRMRKSVMIDVARQEQHRQSVRMRHRRRGHHVRRAWADGGGPHTNPWGAMNLRIGGGREPHRLFVLPSPSRQNRARLIKS